jgi:hypothetical protein
MPASSAAGDVVSGTSFESRSNIANVLFRGSEDSHRSTMRRDGPLPRRKPERRIGKIDPAVRTSGKSLFTEKAMATARASVRRAKRSVRRVKRKVKRAKRATKRAVVRTARATEAVAKRAVRKARRTPKPPLGTSSG